MSTNLCSFSWKHYREILEVAKKAGYNFLLFNEINSKTTEKCCILRHDIDYTPEKAIEFGQLLGISLFQGRYIDTLLANAQGKKTL